MSADIATNRKAGRDFHILEKYEAGLELKGTEVKSIRAGKVNVSDAFARVENNQVFLYGCDIQPWETAGVWFNHPAKRPRRLLLNKREILKLATATTIKGCTLEKPPRQSGTRRRQRQNPRRSTPRPQKSGRTARGPTRNGPLQPALRMRCGIHATGGGAKPSR
jgi:SsrA-binding protein